MQPFAIRQIGRRGHHIVEAQSSLRPTPGAAPTCRATTARACGPDRRRYCVRTAGKVLSNKYVRCTVLGRHQSAPFEGATVKITSSAVSLNVDDVPASTAFLGGHFGFREEMAADGFVCLPGRTQARTSCSCAAGWRPCPTISATTTHPGSSSRSSSMISRVSWLGCRPREWPSPCRLPTRSGESALSRSAIPARGHRRARRLERPDRIAVGPGCQLDRSDSQQSPRCFREMLRRWADVREPGTVQLASSIVSFGGRLLRRRSSGWGQDCRDCDA
jgi:hypothetical protein